MIMSIDRVRLAITAFDEPERLWQTLNDLLKQGIGPEQMCLVARPEALKAVSQVKATILPPAQMARLAGLCSSTRSVPMPAARNGKPLEASCGPLLDLLLQDPLRSPLSVVQSEEDRKLFDEFAHENDVVLVVLSNQPRQQLAATRAMLAGSLRRVTTHEYAIAAPGS